MLSFATGTKHTTLVNSFPPEGNLIYYFTLPNAKWLDSYLSKEDIWTDEH